MELIEIIKKLKEICKKEYLDVSPNCIFENAIKLHISNNINQSKKENIANYQKKEIVSQKPSDEITPKQKAFLIKIKKYKTGMSKQDAFKVIQELNKYKEE